MKLTAEQVVEHLKTMRDLVRAGAEERSEQDRGYVEALDRAIEVVQCDLIESPDERRERFEKWHMDRFGDDEAAIELIEKDEDGGYESGVANAMWLAFNAAMDFRGDA